MRQRWWRKQKIIPAIIIIIIIIIIAIFVIIKKVIPFTNQQLNILQACQHNTFLGCWICRQMKVFETHLLKF